MIGKGYTDDKYAENLPLQSALSSRRGMPAAPLLAFVWHSLGRGCASIGQVLYLLWYPLESGVLLCPLGLALGCEAVAWLPWGW